MHDRAHRPAHRWLLAGLLLQAGAALAQEVKPYQAQEVKPYQAQEVKPYQAQEVKPAGGSPQPQQGSARPAGDVSALLGTWRTRVPGAVWETPSTRPGYKTVHVGAGTRAGDLVIRADGTYTWQSYGGKSGRWVRGDSDYPVVLIDTVEKKRWKVGLDPKRTGGRELIVWDGGSYAYEGRR